MLLLRPRRSLSRLSHYEQVYSIVLRNFNKMLRVDPSPDIDRKAETARKMRTVSTGRLRFPDALSFCAMIYPVSNLDCAPKICAQKQLMRRDAEGHLVWLTRHWALSSPSGKAPTHHRFFCMPNEIQEVMVVA